MDVKPEVAVELRGVAKHFGARVVYRSLDLQVRRGEILTVLGPSGVGKSVMLKLLLGLHRADAGEVLVDGEPVAGRDAEGLRALRRKVGMVFQAAALFDSMSVGENVAYGLREHYRWPEDRIRARVAECLAWVGLPDVERLAPSQLSGGMQKRAAIARALAPGPEVILYDEPTTGLDPANTRRINELIVALRERLGVTSLVITHDIAAAFAVSDRIALLEGGRIRLVVSTEEARTSPPPALAAFVGGEESAA